MSRPPIASSILSARSMSAAMVRGSVMVPSEYRLPMPACMSRMRGTYERIRESRIMEQRQYFR